MPFFCFYPPSSGIASCVGTMLLVTIQHLMRPCLVALGWILIRILLQWSHSSMPIYQHVITNAVIIISKIESSVEGIYKYALAGIPTADHWITSLTTCPLGHRSSVRYGSYLDKYVWLGGSAFYICVWNLTKIESLARGGSVEVGGGRLR